MMDKEDQARYHRELRSMASHASDDPMALKQVLDLLFFASIQVDKAVGALLNGGYSYADIAKEIGITRQAAHRRYSHCERLNES